MMDHEQVRASPLSAPAETNGQECRGELTELSDHFTSWCKNSCPPIAEERVDAVQVTRSFQQFCGVWALMIWAPLNDGKL